MAIWLDMASGSLWPWRWWCYGYAPDIDERSATLIRDPIVHIPHLSRCHRRAASRSDWACSYGWL